MAETPILSLLHNLVLYPLDLHTAFTKDSLFQHGFSMCGGNAGSIAL
jgi:hypothetical protein